MHGTYPCRSSSGEVCPCHCKEVLILPFPLLLHVRDKGMVVLSNGRRVGVLRPQLLFSDGQGTRIQRLGLLVLALGIVECCQVIEA